MEDLIYVLLALLWIVFSVVKARQKQSPKPAADEQTPPKTSWEQMLEELLPPETEEEENYPSPPELDAPKTSETITGEQYVSPYRAYAMTDYQPEENTIPEIVSLEDIDGTNSLLSGHALSTEFAYESSQRYNPALLIELRRAVVYTAVLERPAW
jgi:hypothetical protein